MKHILAATALLLCLAACSPEPADAPDVAPGAANESAPPRRRAVARSTAVRARRRPARRQRADARRARRAQDRAGGAGGQRLGRARRADFRRAAARSARPISPASMRSSRTARCGASPSASAPTSSWSRASASAPPRPRCAPPSPGFREAPHEYSEPPAKYLTAPNARERRSGAALRDRRRRQGQPDPRRHHAGARLCRGLRLSQAALRQRSGLWRWALRTARRVHLHGRADQRLERRFVEDVALM